jgi:hypothetical protein
MGIRKPKLTQFSSLNGLYDTVPPPTKQALLQRALQKAPTEEPTVMEEAQPVPEILITPTGEVENNNSDADTKRTLIIQIYWRFRCCSSKATAL